MKATRILTSVLALIVCMSFTIHDDKQVKLAKHLKERFAEVSAGPVVIDGERSAVESFYISKYEVSNLDYAEFLAHLKAVGSTADLEIAAVDADKWLMPGTHMEPFAKTYHMHPAYHEYPVVNVSHDAAVLYCDWLEHTLNESAEGKYRVEILLPSRQEWVRAARASDIKARYAWSGHYLRNAQGQTLCNYNGMSAELIHFNEDTGTYEVRTEGADRIHDQALITAPCASYPPNNLGIYNMNGNVAEMVNDASIAVGGSWKSPGYDVRIESVMTFEEPSPLVGFRPVMKIQKIED